VAYEQLVERNKVMRGRIKMGLAKGIGRGVKKQGRGTKTMTACHAYGTRST